MHNRLVDVRALVRSKYSGWVPGFLLSALERLIHQEELNELMQLQDYVGGVDLSNRLLRRLGISVELIGAERLPGAGERVLFASNHPLGGADGIVLTALLGSYFRSEAGGAVPLSVMVTDLLLQVWQMGDVFVPVNKYGAQSRERETALREALEGSGQILTFPAGQVSRKERGGEIRDSDWRPGFAKLAKRHERDILPLFFEGYNSKTFYRTEQIRMALGMKVNLGTVLLPGEFLGARGKHFKVYVGEPISYASVPTGPEVKVFANRLRDEIYTYPERYAGEESTPFAPLLPGEE